jgi:hypothetical protein
VGSGSRHPRSPGDGPHEGLIRVAPTEDGLQPRAERFLPSGDLSTHPRLARSR